MARPRLVFVAVLLCISVVAAQKPLEKGPRIIEHPKSPVFFAEGFTQVSFECQASGYPPPQYRWQRVGHDGKASAIAFSNKYFGSPNSGKLKINEIKDSDMGKYQCLAINKFGTVVSRPTNLERAYINKFSSSSRDNVNVELYYDAVINCKAPAHYPALNYTWYKNTPGPGNMINSNQKPYTFVSKNGKLYFSRVTSADQGYYYCLARLTIPLYSNTEKSKAIQLVVGTGAAKRPPRVHQEFPLIFPLDPKFGDNVTLECFAAGTGNLQYSWSHNDNTKMSRRVSFSDRNRVLTITGAQPGDIGDYTCKVSASGLSGETGTDSKRVHLMLLALPTIVKPLRNIDAIVGQRFSLHCLAEGIPHPTYTWWKNGKPFKPQTLSTKDLESRRIIFYGSGQGIMSNSVVFQRAERHDAGMYQCRVANVLGTNYSTSRIRVEEKFRETPPEILSQPEEKVFFRMAAGRLELQCDAQGFPRPKFTWKKNDVDLDFDSPPKGRITQVTGTGGLIIIDPLKRDEGIYQCFAKNDLGVAVTHKIQAINARLDSFPVQSNSTTYSPEVGKALILKCHPPTSMPRAEMFWRIIFPDGRTSQLIFDKRVSMDPNGYLYFANVQEGEGTRGGKTITYQCCALNSVLKTVKCGGDSQIKVTGGRSSLQVPRLLFRSPDTVAEAGKKLVLKCIFAAFPTPEVTWFKDYQPVVPSTPQRVYFSSYGQELVFDPVEEKDAGKYVCAGKSSSSSMPAMTSVEVKVVSKPSWLARPRNADFVEKRATFSCAASGNPKPDIKWYVNGVDIDKVPDPKRSQRTSKVPDSKGNSYEMKELIFQGLTARILNGKYIGDSKVIQCNASNPHGYVFENAYLNVVAIRVSGSSGLYGTYLVAMILPLVLSVWM